MNILHYVVVVQTEDVNIAIEVSRKSKKAFVADKYFSKISSNGQQKTFPTTRRYYSYFLREYTACTFWINSIVVMQFFFFLWAHLFCN